MNCWDGSHPAHCILLDYDGCYTWGELGRDAAIGAVLGGAGKAIGLATKGVPAAFGDLSRAEEFGILPYNQLTKLIKGMGLEAHHLLEKRFERVLGVKAGEMLSVAVTKAEHQIFTNLWRQKISYGLGTGLATRAEVEAAARAIYKDYPAILKALGL